jgi:geranylgeranyl diphosphate synthase type II
MDGIPPGRLERDRLRRVVQDHLLGVKAVPPVPLDELRTHAGAVARAAGIDDRYRDYLAILLNNEMWRESFAAVPFANRLLLLPKCLRAEGRCRARFDELGLLCGRCGGCAVGDLQEEAERLGYAVLVAEGSPVVMSLIKSGKVHAVIGVSCMAILESAFPYMEAGAIPGIAIPLLHDGCRQTDVDLDWVWDAIHLTRDDRTRRLDLDALRAEVNGWFAPEALDAALGPAAGPTEALARDWLARQGKRWRPFLAVCAHQAILDDPAAPVPDAVRRVALAVECFHKASLIHDDIEDGDAVRYGEKTLHAEHGVPVALNVGDFLIGEGYRQIAACGAPADRMAEMLRAATDGHRQLCLGQGAELGWARRPEPLDPAAVLDIFRKKTAPAFEVALRLGALCAGAGAEVGEVLRRYSAALGVAYQIRDDLEDFGGGDAAPADAGALRPSLLLALAHARAVGPARERTEALWRRGIAGGGEAAAEAAALAAELRVEEEARELLEAHKAEAIRALRPLGNAGLKGMLRRILAKIFNDIRLRGWCREREAGRAGERAAGA